MAQVAALIAAGVASALAPTIQDIDEARTVSMPGNFTHCVQLKDLHCVEQAGTDGQFDCSYREYADKGDWPLKKITVGKVDGYWTKLAGDTPRCTVVNLQIMDQR